MVDIVDEKDKAIGRESRNICHEKGLRHRIVGIFLFNAEGKLWLQTRSVKKAGGKKLDFSASGHVGEGDSYHSAAARELKEELGITTQLHFLTKTQYEKKGEGNHRRHFLAIYVGKHDGPFTLQEDEVEKIEAYDLEEAKKLVEEDSRTMTIGLKIGIRSYLAQSKD